MTIKMNDHKPEQYSILTKKSAVMNCDLLLYVLLAEKKSAVVIFSICFIC